MEATIGQWADYYWESDFLSPPEGWVEIESGMPGVTRAFIPPFSGEEKMSTVPDNQTSPIQYAPKAGNTTETLAARPVEQVAEVSNVAKQTKQINEEVSKDKKAQVLKAVPAVINQEKEVSREEFQQLADAVQELAERIRRFNQLAPFKIPE